MNDNEIVKAKIKAIKAKSVGKGLSIIGLGAAIVGEVAFNAPNWCVG